VTPGQAEHAEDELRRADKALASAHVLLDLPAPADAASRLYYAVFHAARAALTIRGVYSKTHSGLIGLFVTEYGPAPILNTLLKLRAAADYEMAAFTEPQVRLLQRAEEAASFVERCREIVAKAVASGPDEPDPPPDL
jgi:uncharacterized protein (UPF0332 family)